MRQVNQPKRRINKSRVALTAMSVIGTCFLIAGHFQKSQPSRTSFIVCIDTTGSSLYALNAVDRRNQVETFLGGARYDDPVLFVAYGAQRSTLNSVGAKAMSDYDSQIQSLLNRNRLRFESGVKAACAELGIKPVFKTSNFASIDGKKRETPPVLDFESVPSEVWPLYLRNFNDGDETMYGAKHSVALSEINDFMVSHRRLDNRALFITDFKLESGEKAPQDALSKYKNLSDVSFYRSGDTLRKPGKSVLDMLQWKRLSMPSGGG